MDAIFPNFSNSIDNLRFEHGSTSQCSNKNLGNGYKQISNSTKGSSLDSTSEIKTKTTTTTTNSFSENNDDYPQAVLKYINCMLMEEDLEGQTDMLQDCLALQAAEKSFFDVLTQHSPSSPTENQNPDLDLDSNPHLHPSFDNSVLFGSPENFQQQNSRGKKNSLQEEDGEFESWRRSNKQCALSLQELEPSDMFDDVLLSTPGDQKFPATARRTSPKSLSRSKRNETKTEVVDFWTLLTQCAQALTSFDQKTAADLIDQIRKHSSQFGDGTQRMAFYFCNALEARLIGTKTPAYSPLLSNRTPVSDILNGYRVYVTSCPFKKMSNFFSNRTLLKFAQTSKRIHIIDFGILYGFQWPCLIQSLAEREGGPPALRITGIELPQPGFRPTERVEETGRRLKRYCERFNVPFEYNFIANKWEMIKLEDLKINRDEFTVVNCIYRLKHIPDDTLSMNSSRDQVLKLIESIKPDLFVHGVMNGNYNAPFFVTRFREALFHYSALFDMFDATLPREDPNRLLFEKEVFGRDAMNVIACEGMERVERPEAYKQWQTRDRRAGLEQMELDEGILKKIKTMVRNSYHKDFVIDVDGNWILQGWKGRVIYALSCWRPRQS